MFACLVNATESCAKTDEPIEMPFGMWTHGSRRNRMLGEGPGPPPTHTHKQVAHFGEGGLDMPLPIPDILDLIRKNQ